MKKITVLIPAYNEENNLHRVVAALDELTSHTTVVVDNGKEEQLNAAAYDWEYLFVNDGSRDNTLDVLHDLRKQNRRVNVLNLSRNFGKENAMLAGMDYAKGDALVIMDADLQDPVDVIPAMIYWWRQGYDDVYGRRRTRGKESWLRKQLSVAYYKMLQKVSDIDILPNVGDFRLLDRRVVDAICNLRETQRYTKGLYFWVGFKKKEILFDRDDRSEGKSSFNFSSLLNLGIEGLTSFSNAPLRISSIVGIIVSIIAAIYLLLMLGKILIFGEQVQGFPTLLSVIVLLGGLQLVSLGIIGEYIGRIFNETKGRPAYIVESYNEEKK